MKSVTEPALPGGLGGGRHERPRRLTSGWAAAKAAVKAVLPDRVIFVIRRAKVAAQRRTLVQVPTVPQFLEILHDHHFQKSVREIKYITEYDTARLANLWQLCRMSDPNGNILEVGVLRGGTAIHLMNCQPTARFVLADTFTHVDADEVMRRLHRKGTRLTVLRGVFPGSDTLGEVKDISFAHIDVVVYDSCRSALDYVSRRCRPSAIIMINDCIRHPWGVTEAVCEFADAHPEWIVLPIYPGQGVAMARDGSHPIARLGASPGIERIARDKLPTFGTKADPLPAT
jgi:hypothetical protein